MICSWQTEDAFRVPAGVLSVEGQMGARAVSVMWTTLSAFQTHRSQGKTAGGLTEIWSHRSRFHGHRTAPHRDRKCPSGPPESHFPSCKWPSGLREAHFPSCKRVSGLPDGAFPNCKWPPGIKGAPFRPVRGLPFQPEGIFRPVRGVAFKKTALSVLSASIR